MSTPYKQGMVLAVGAPSRFSETIAQLTVLQQIAAKSEQRFSELPFEEQQRINREREASREQKRIASFIHQGRCPVCEGRLVRGKKDKKNDYKRTWNCAKCVKSFSM